MDEFLMAPDDSHRVVTATSFLANTACPSRQQNWDNCRGMDSDINWGSRLKTQLCLLAGTPGNSVFILPCSRAPSNNRQRNTKEEKDMPPGTSQMVTKCFVWTTLWLMETELQASWKTDYHPVRIFADHHQGSFVLGMQWKVTLRKEGGINWEIQAMSE